MSRKANKIKNAIEQRGYPVERVWWKQPSGNDNVVFDGWYVQLKGQDFGEVIAHSLEEVMRVIPILYPDPPTFKGQDIYYAKGRAPIQ